MNWDSEFGEQQPRSWKWVTSAAPRLAGSRLNCSPQSFPKDRQLFKVFSKILKHTMTENYADEFGQICVAFHGDGSTGQNAGVADKFG